MSYEEKRSWIRLGAAVVAYGVYLVIVVGRGIGQPAGGMAYAWVLILSAVAAIVASAGLEIALAARTPRDGRGGDERDREIGRLGDRVGQAFVVIGGLAGMVLAMTETDRFWTANVIYLGFALSAIVGGVAKVVVYRVGMPRW
ncbi:hypothetical protein [Actinoplanes sp. NPDC023714]|uniref:hypothetical protein n=1 Tax=Actinoplanes sp. NPDC023714 TaxID=3154322 RepID=UPI0033F890E0